MEERLQTQAMTVHEMPFTHSKMHIPVHVALFVLERAQNAFPLFNQVRTQSCVRAHMKFDQQT